MQVNLALCRLGVKGVVMGGIIVLNAVASIAFYTSVQCGKNHIIGGNSVKCGQLFPFFKLSQINSKCHFLKLNHCFASKRTCRLIVIS